jgi:hypothetical protein
MAKIAILYICTGNYSIFWEGFFKTFEERFLPNTEKHYHVFTDSDKINENICERVYIHELAPLPWPLVTLLRFHTFLSIEEKLRQYDYCVFFNSNFECEMIITEDEFLPQEENGEEIVVAKHPGYINSFPAFYPLERRKMSKAYVPYNNGKYYCIGALIGGTSESFLKMSRILRSAIDEDLKNNIIANWHDESHFNRYIIGRTDLKILEPSFCYPWPAERYKPVYLCKIRTISKEDKFDIETFKGQYAKKKPFILHRVIKKLLSYIIPLFLFVFDTIAGKKVKPYE